MIPSRQVVQLMRLEIVPTPTHPFTSPCYPFALVLVAVIRTALSEIVALVLLLVGPGALNIGPLLATWFTPRQLTKEAGFCIMVIVAVVGLGLSMQTPYLIWRASSSDHRNARLRADRRAALPGLDISQHRDGVEDGEGDLDPTWIGTFGSLSTLAWTFVSVALLHGRAGLTGPPACCRVCPRVGQSRWMRNGSQAH